MTTIQSTNEANKSNFDETSLFEKLKRENTRLKRKYNKTVVAFEKRLEADPTLRIKMLDVLKEREQELIVLKAELLRSRSQSILN